MSYAATLHYLYGLQKHGVKLGLETTWSLLRAFGDPQQRYAALHVGGTNGKGSTATMAASILRAAGYRVGLYTSPHLVAFNERISVNGDAISDQEIVKLTERLRGAVGITIDPTFFEFTTVMAFQYFADQRVDLAVVEVGMGGRFDATNVLTPLVSVITNVALDHQAYLGHTVGAIAHEKAGIIKPGLPVVVGRLNHEASAVLAVAASERRAPLYRLNEAFHIEGDSVEAFRYDGMARSFSDLSCPLRGRHQLDNAACALAMLELASQEFRISEDAVRLGLQAVRWEGRLEIVERRPLLVLDGAHNPAAATVVGDYLARHRSEHPGSRVILVVSLMRDKDHHGFFQAVLPSADDVVLTRAQLDRAATIEELLGAVGGWRGIVHGSPSPSDALALARRLASAGDLICVTGSLMLVGEVKALLRGCVLSSLRG
ncbi:MAG: bifunctional folylpolyglutamate synthase/dihydrofolate synthase [Nitrospiraceae bacterium]